MELEPGQTRKETEGVFVIRDGRAEFVPIKIGIAGDRYFEVLSGIKPGEQVITGPYANVRGMADGDQVRVQQNANRMRACRIVTTVERPACVIRRRVLLMDRR